MDWQPIPGEVSVRRSTTCVVHCAASVPSDLADALYRRPGSLLANGKLLRVNGARRTVLFEWGSARFVLKHYVEPSWRHALKQLVKRSRAWSSWFASHRLADVGIATPRPVACIENRWGPLRRDSFLMYPYVEGRTLGECLSSQQLAAADGRALWRQLEDLWKRLQQLRVSLADANVGNFIVTPDCRLWVIDLDKTRFHRFDFLARPRQHRGWRQLQRSIANNCSDTAMLEIFGGAGATAARSLSPRGREAA